MTSTLDNSAGAPLRRMAVGSAWMIGARWGARAIGVISTIILARLLAPADFGLVAMCTLTVAFVRVFADAGQIMAIIRHSDPTPEHFDTAWSMSVCMGFAVALVLLACAPVAGWYFHEPRTVPLLAFFALAPLIDGFTNIGAAAGFRRDLQFDREFRFLLLQKLSGFVITLPLALVLRDYWALAGGLVLGKLIVVLASYWMHPYRPRFRLTKLRELWSYSVWMQVAGVAQYFGMEGDQFIVGGLAGATAMGEYNVGADLATAPTNEIVGPTSRALFPVYAKLLDEPARFVRSYLDALSFFAIIGLSTGVGIALVSGDMVAVILGPQWSAAARLVPWLAVGGGLYGVTRSVNNVLSVTGNARINAMRNGAFAVLLVPVSLLAGLRWGSEGVAAARTLVTFLFAPVMFYSLMKAVPVTAGQIIERTWRPGFAALAMAAIVLLSETNALASAPLRLLCHAGLGAVTFVAVLFALWQLSGRPEGPERLVADATRRGWRSLRRSLRSPPLPARELNLRLVPLHSGDSNAPAGGALKTHIETDAVCRELHEG